MVPLPYLWLKSSKRQLRSVSRARHYLTVRPLRRPAEEPGGDIGMAAETISGEGEATHSELSDLIY